jgi:hypothetical protein
VITTKPTGNVSGLVNAIRDQTQVLPERASGVTNALIIFDAGAPILGPGVRLSDIETSCKVAKDANILRIVVSLYGTNGRLGGIKNCVSPTWMFRSGDPNGKDLLGSGGIMDTIAGALIRGTRATGSEYSDKLNSAFFEYVKGSGVVDGRPNEPGIIGANELSWPFTGDPPAGGRVIEYKAKAYDDSGEGKGPLSASAQLALIYPGVPASRSLTVDNPDMCVYMERRPTYCDSFALTLTPPAGGTPVDTPTTPPTVPAQDTPTATAPPSATDTPEPPTDTPTPEPPSPTTPATTGGRAYLPLVLSNADVRAR